MVEPKHLTAQAYKLLNGLEKHPNQWLTRREIAKTIGKKRLTPYDIALLDLLAERNLVNRSQEEGFSREGYRWIYGIFDENDPS